MPFVAWETGVSLTTSAGLRVMAEAACDMLPYSTHRRESIWPEGGVHTRARCSQTPISIVTTNLFAEPSTGKIPLPVTNNLY
jgi:hypothetical protein